MSEDEKPFREKFRITDSPPRGKELVLTADGEIAPDQGPVTVEQLSDLLEQIQQRKKDGA